MSCLIDAGISRACDFSVGGIKSGIWIVNDADVTGVTYGTNGQITGATAGTFYEFQPELQSAGFTQSLNAGQVSKFVSQVLVFSVAALTQAKVEILNTLALGSVQCVFQANDGNWYWMADNGSSAKSTALEVVSGTADADDAMATITLTASNKGYAPTVDEDILAGLGIV